MATWNLLRAWCQGRRHSLSPACHHWIAANISPVQRQWLDSTFSKMPKTQKSLPSILRYAVWCAGASPSEVGSAWVTGSSRLTGRAWWPRHMRRSSRPCRTPLERLNSLAHIHTHTHTPCRGDFLFDLLTETEIYFSLFFDRSTWRPCRQPCSDF